jgi:hypothetical protein
VKGIMLAAAMAALGTVAPDDDTTVQYCGRPWTVFAPAGALAIDGTQARFSVRTGTKSAHDVAAKRDPMPERAFLTSEFFAGIGPDHPFHIHFVVTVLPGPTTTALWTDLMQLMPYADRDPVTKAFIEPFPSPQLGLYNTAEKDIEYFSWQTRYEPNRITVDTNPHWQERGRVPLVRGQKITWDIDCVDSRGGPGGSLKIVMNKGLPTETTVVDATNTPIGFNDDMPSYPAIGAYRDSYHAPGDVLNVVFDGFMLDVRNR